jgi:hypothetical protein
MDTASYIDMCLFSVARCLLYDKYIRCFIAIYQMRSLWNPLAGSSRGKIPQGDNYKITHELVLEKTLTKAMQATNINNVRYYEKISAEIL